MEQDGLKVSGPEQSLENLALKDLLVQQVKMVTTGKMANLV